MNHIFKGEKSVFLFSLFFFAGVLVRAEERPRWGVVQVSVVDVRSASGTVAKSYAQDSRQETQLLYGEKVTILDENEDWALVDAEDQPEFSHNERWQGYPGWIPKAAVFEMKRLYDPNFIVCVKKTALYPKPESSKKPQLWLSLGSKLEMTGLQKNDWWQVRLPARGKAWVNRKDVRLLTTLPEEDARKLVLLSAEKLLGDPYFWGGLSAHLKELKPAVTAVDCSGLVHLAFRVAGIEVPRDSFEQHLRARPVKAEDLKPGDLVFSGPESKPGKITHVAFYLGEGMLLEAPQTGDRVRKISFREKYGVSINSLDPDLPTVGERRFSFGTFWNEDSHQ